MAFLTAWRDKKAKLSALDRSQAIIEFALDGTILDANQNFLNVVGYRLDEIKGRHHRLFVEPQYAGSADYQKFWDSLRAGQFDAQEYKRIAKGGREIVRVKLEAPPVAAKTGGGAFVVLAAGKERNLRTLLTRPL